MRKARTPIRRVSSSRTRWLVTQCARCARCRRRCKALAVRWTILKGFAQLDHFDLHAAHAEIQRLREAIPTINASGAVVKFASDGSISIVADHVEITGTVHA